MSQPTPLHVADTGARAGPVARLRAGFGEFLDARELVYNMVRRDLKVQHRGSFLGLLWSLMTPLLQVAVYSFVFKVIARVPLTPGTSYPFAVHLFAGLTLWGFYSKCVGDGTNSVVGASYLLRKLWFPRSILPLANLLSALVTMGFELAVLLVTTMAFGIWPSGWLLMIPVYVLIVAVLGYGLSLFLSALQVFYRDVAHFVGIFMMMWFWTTPVLYSLDIIPIESRRHQLLLLNPMTAPMSAYRNAILEHRLGIEPVWLLYSAGVAIIALLVGSLVFHRTQKLFPEMV